MNIGKVEMGEKTGQITVIVTIHNAERYLWRCITSLKEQDTQDFCVIFVDDGSSDQSRAICQTMIEQMTVPVKLLSLPRGGVAMARNAGLEQVETEYVVFLDCDDWLDQDTISGLYKMVKETSLEVGVFGFYYEMGSGYQRQVCLKGDRSYFSQEHIKKDFTKLWNSGLMYSACNKIFQVSLLQKYGIQFQMIDLGEDLEFCKAVVQLCNRLVISSRCYYHYTCHVSGSLSTSYREDLFEIRRREHERLTEYFEQMGCLTDSAIEYLSRRYIERLVGCIENICSPESKKPWAARLAKVKCILEEKETQRCAARAHLTSIRMKLLVIPMQHRWCRLTLLSGYVISACRRRMPVLFAWLKMSR